MENRVLFQLFSDSVIETGPSRSNPASTIVTFLSVLIFAWLYLLMLLYDTLATRNIYQTVALTAYSLVIVLTLGLQLSQIEDTIISLRMLNAIASDTTFIAGELLIAAITIPGVLICVQLGLTVQLRKVFGGVILKQLEADVRLRGYYRWVEVSIVCLGVCKPLRTECLLMF